MSAVQIGCRLARYWILLQWFLSPPVGTIFSPADVCNNHLLTCIYAFLVNNWNSWGEKEARNICKLGDMIVSIYDQPLAFIDLTEDDDMDNDMVAQVEPQEDEVPQEWLVIDELEEDDLPEPEEEPENEGDEMLFAFDHLLGNQDTESESDLSDESVSDFEDSEFLTSESEDSGVEV
jgi:hypothetical protein